MTAGPAAFTYDANGILTSDGGTTFTYDVENRLISATGARNVTLTYDPLGRLWQTSGPSGTRQFLYDGDALVAEYDASGNMLRRYVHGAGADTPLAWFEGSGLTLASRRYLFTNHQGSVTAIADGNGNTIHINTYDEYGIPGAGNIGRFQYTGQAWLEDLGVYHYKARIYSPTLGRFLQTDPIGYDDQVNLYAYVANDPVNKVDPDGQEAACITNGGTCTDPNGITLDKVINFATAILVAVDILDGPAPDVGAAAVTARTLRAERMAQNAASGARREREVAAALRRENPGARVQGQSTLRDSSGRIVRDPKTGEVRRVDHAVIRGDKARTVETTSPTAPKAGQLAKEQRIRDAGGTHIRDRKTGKLCSVSGVSEVRRCN